MDKPKEKLSTEISNKKSIDKSLEEAKEGKTVRFETVEELMKDLLS
jgi:hypothetical protein